MDWKKGYWEETVAQALEEAGVPATKDQIKAIAADMLISADNMGMLDGSEHRTESNNELDTLKKKLADMEEFDRLAVACEYCKGRGYVTDCWDRKFSCDMCGGKGRLVK